MSFKIGNYDVCILDLLCDTTTGKLSTSKIWQHIANGIMSRVMLTQDDVGFELILAYGSIVGGSYVAIQFLKWRYRDATDPAATKDNSKLGVE